MVRFQGTAADLEKFRVAPQPLHRVLAHVAVPAHHLDCPVGHVFAHHRAVQLDAVRVEPLATFVKVKVERRLVQVGLARPVLGIRLADVPLHLAEGVELLAEGRPLRRVGVHRLQAAPRDADAHRRQHDALDLEVAHHAERRAAKLAHQIGGGHLNVLKDELRGGRRAHTTLVFEPLPEGEARHASLDQKERDGLGWPHVGTAGARVHEEHVARVRVVDSAVGDPHLGAVQLEAAVGLRSRGGAHRKHVRAAARLAHSHTADVLARARARQPLLQLCRSPIPSQIVHKQLGVRQVRQAKGRVGVAELLVDNACGGGIHSGATVLWVRGDSEESELAGALEQGAVQTLLAIVLQGLRLHLILGELLHHLAQGSVLGCRIGRVELLLHRLGRVGERR
mmetsp:Transcript_24890/g.59638  ORF Transcript_24890/g.59638 Transcript_24890/m.59638 type:complete len:395 (-) Transcript_24890:99-1283(-)